MLEQIGLEPERVRMFHMSSAMAGQFAAAASEMTEQIEALGPNPLRLAGKTTQAMVEDCSSIL